MSAIRCRALPSSAPSNEVTLSIVMPTIPGREDELARSVEAYERLTPVPIEWIVERGHTVCGTAWNAGALKATGDILHIGSDDLEPETDAWFPAALSAIEQDLVPVGWVREDELGVFGRDFCRVPICRREWWQDVPPIHIWSDNAFTELMIAGGHMPRVADGFDFYHRRSMIGRDETPQHIAADFAAYKAWGGKA
jgi:hypothetical protein